MLMIKKNFHNFQKNYLPPNLAYSIMKFAKKNINIYLGVAEYLYLYSSLGGENTVVVSKLTSSEIDIWW